MPHQEHRQALPAGTQLREYEILHTLGSGGFGVAYLAYDRELAHKVVLKEYLPAASATRLAGNTVVPTTSKDEADFQWGLECFLSEARALVAFRTHRNIVSVLHSFRANNTAYMVMEYAGEFSLQQFLDGQTTLTQVQLLDLVLPLLDALETIHAAGVIHRDIKPGNILINDQAEPVLIDFGAARQALGERSHSIGTVLTPGYAPFEQYHSASPQGAWTDIYAMAAVMYRCVTGEIPPDSPARMETGEVLTLKPRADYTPQLLAAIAWGLQVRAAERPQTVAAWRDVILAAGQVVAVTPETPEMLPNPHPPVVKPKQRFALFALSGVLLLGISILVFATIQQPTTPQPDTAMVAVSPEPAPEPLPTAIQTELSGDEIELTDTDVLDEETDVTPPVPLLPIASGNTANPSQAAVTPSDRSSTPSKQAKPKKSKSKKQQTKPKRNKPTPPYIPPQRAKPKDDRDPFENGAF